MVQKTDGFNSHGQMTSWARILSSRSSFLWSLLPWYGDHSLLENVSFLTVTIILLLSQSSIADTVRTKTLRSFFDACFFFPHSAHSSPSPRYPQWLCGWFFAQPPILISGKTHTSCFLSHLYCYFSSTVVASATVDYISLNWVRQFATFMRKE